MGTSLGFSLTDYRGEVGGIFRHPWLVFTVAPSHFVWAVRAGGLEAVSSRGHLLRDAGHAPLFFFFYIFQCAGNNKRCWQELSDLMHV